jgi:primase-polymerase (primpol)-like protein
MPPSTSPAHGQASTKRRSLQRGGVDGIGFVLTEADPFVFVDLDDTHGDDEALQRQYRIFHDFNDICRTLAVGRRASYHRQSEVARRGPQARPRRIYDRKRYMTMTGDVYRVEAINDVQDQAALLWHQMGGPAAIHHYEGDQPQREDDNAIIERARKALNGDKFTMLFEGDWRNRISRRLERSGSSDCRYRRILYAKPRANDPHLGILATRQAREVQSCGLSHVHDQQGV